MTPEPRAEEKSGTILEMRGITKTYENGVKTVPSYLLKPVLVTRDNWKDILVKSGYYKEEQITQ